MKRRELLRRLTERGCRFVREGGSHTIWESPDGTRRSAIPRHTEIAERTAKAILKQLVGPTADTE